MKVPMFTCCFATYGKNDNDVVAASFIILRIGDKSDEVVYKDWLWKEDPKTGVYAGDDAMDKFIDKNVKFLAKNYKGTSVSMVDDTVPLEKCGCNCGEYLYRSIRYKDFIAANG